MLFNVKQFLLFISLNVGRKKAKIKTYQLDEQNMFNIFRSISNAYIAT